MRRYPGKKEDWAQFKVESNEKRLNIGGWQVMQSWEKPLMDFMARQVTWNHGDVLEIGFGMGISATRIVQHGCRSYTVIEAHPEIARRARHWAERQNTSIRVLEGFWQDETRKLTRKFDGILFDTFPFHRKEKSSNHFPFIPEAPRLLRTSGLLTYFSDEIVPFRISHLNLLLNYFNDVRLVRVSGLRPPKDCEYWKHDYMIVPVCRKATNR